MTARNANDLSRSRTIDSTLLASPSPSASMSLVTRVKMLPMEWRSKYERGRRKVRV